MVTRKEEILIIKNFFLNAAVVGIATGVTLEWNKWWSETRKVTAWETIGIATASTMLSFLILHALFGFEL